MAGKSNRTKGVTNSILEEEEDKKTEYGGDGYSSANNSKADDRQPSRDDAVVKLNFANMTDKQRKRAIREEFLRRAPNQLVTMIKSPFPNREPFLFFPYAPFLKMQRRLPNDHSRIIQYN